MLMKFFNFTDAVGYFEHFDHNNAQRANSDSVHIV